MGKMVILNNASLENLNKIKLRLAGGLGGGAMADMPTKRNSEYGHKEENIRGTFLSVFLIGGFILLLWFVVFFIYLARV